MGYILATALAQQIPNPVLVGEVQGIASAFANDNKSWTLGMRYDFHESADFKVEYKYKDDHLMNKQAELVLFSVDVVF